MKLKAILAAGALALAASSAHADVVTFYQYGAGAPSATLVDNFSQDTLGYVPTSSSSYSWSSNVPWTYVTHGDSTGKYAAPATSPTTTVSGYYLAVLANGTSTLTLSKPVTGLEIYVGSLSSNNVISFSNGLTYTGSQLEAISGATDANAQHSPQTNGIFDFSFSTAVTSVTFTDNAPNAFEIASISSVPEPATWAMMLAGLFGIGAAIRFGRRNAAAATA